jgi:hypothetical protein
MAEKKATVALKMFYDSERGSDNDEQPSHVHGPCVLLPRHGAARVHSGLPHQSPVDDNGDKHEGSASCTNGPTMMMWEPISRADLAPDNR